MSEVKVITFILVYSTDIHLKLYLPTFFLSSFYGYFKGVDIVERVVNYNHSAGEKNLQIIIGLLRIVALVT